MQAVIIGNKTKKVLFLGVKNRFCYMCAKHNGSSQIPDHTCAKNYSGPPTAMEWMLIVEGIRELYEVHGVWCKFLIGDGDSSVYQKIRERTPRGSEVCKLECCNHLVRCYMKNLYKMQTDTKSITKEGRDLLEGKIDRLVRGLRMALINN